MSKFNSVITKAQQIEADPTRITNHAGGIAFDPSDAHKLYLMCVTALLDDKYYQDNAQTLESLQNLCQKVDRNILLFLGKYCRQHLHLRSISHLLLAEASMKFSTRSDESKSDVRLACQDIIQRVDDITEVLAYWLSRNANKKAKLPNALKKGLAEAFLKFDEYALAKYNRDGAVKLRDAVCMIHPKPKTPEQAALIKRLLEDKMAKPDTWEVHISEHGSNAQTWNHIAPRMGIMAQIRNLRNFEKHEANDALKLAITNLQDQAVIEKSKQLPFRFLAAEREVSQQATRDALRTALQLSIQNIPKLSGDTLYVVDASGSMSTALTKRSKIVCADIANLLAAIGVNLSESSRVIVFGREAKEVNLSKLDSVITNADRIRLTDVGHATYAHLAMELAIVKRIKVDRIVVLSDEQCYGQSAGFFLSASQTLSATFDAYRKKINPETKLYSIDLQGYGQLQFSHQDKGVYQLGGFSERIYELIAQIESGENPIAHLLK